MPAKQNQSTQTPLSLRPDHLIRHATFRQLQIFESVYRLASFTRAAEELFLTQPTVSMQIKKLTDAVGLPLFEHVGRRVEPTEAGSELYQACRQVFDVLSNLEMKLSDMQGLKRGRLRLGAITTAKYIAPELLGAFSQNYPGIDLALKVTNRERILERMNANEDDLYILGKKPVDDLEIEEYRFAPNPLVVLAPRNHPLAGEKNISLERLCEEPFIIREPGSGTRDATLKQFESRGLRPWIRMELGSSEAIKHTIIGGLGISVMSLHTLTLDGRGGPMTILDVEGFPIERYWNIVHPKGKELSLAAQAFLQFVIDCKPEISQRMQNHWPALKEHLVVD